MKIGVIGTGYWGKKHVQEFLNLGNDVIIADSLEKNRKFCKKNFNVTTFENYYKLLADPSISSVSICTPNETHKKIAIDALKYKKNILVEKPLALSTSDINEILNLAKKENKIVMTGHVFRFNSAIKKIKELVTNNEIGDVFLVELTWSEFYPLIGENSLIGKNILYDQGIHPIDIVDYIFSPILEKLNLFTSGFRMDDSEYSIFNFKFKNNSKMKDTLVTIKLSWITPIRKRELIIVGSEKTIIADCTSQDIQIIDNINKSSFNIPIEKNDPLHDELKFFLECSKQPNLLQLPYPMGKIGEKIVKIIESTINLN